MTKFIFVYITCPSEDVAKTIAKTLLNQSLISCANFFPIQSMYWWKHKIKESNEWVLIVKTTAENSVVVQEKVEKIHPYSIPCITILPVQPNTVYKTWLTQQLTITKHPPSTKHLPQKSI